MVNMKKILAVMLLPAFITPALAQEEPFSLPPDPLTTPRKPELPDIFGGQPGSTSRDMLLRRMREVRDAYRKEYGKHVPAGEITECAEFNKITTCYTHPF